MSRLQFRSVIAPAAFLVVLLGARPASAQAPYNYVIEPGPHGLPPGLVNNVITGVQYDIANQKHAEKRLGAVHAKLHRDLETGHTGAAEHDARKIHNLKYRIVVDEWLIRKYFYQNPGCYPYPNRLDPITCKTIAQYGPLPQIP